MGGTVLPTGPDLESGVDESSLGAGGMLVGHVGTEPVLLVRSGSEILAVGAVCTHYGGPLGEGRCLDGAVVCPLHHARFDLRSGAATSPAFQPVDCWRVERRGGTLVVREKSARSPKPRSRAGPQRIVILGGGAAGHAAAETLRREGYGGMLTIVSADPSPPYDRTNVSKDYLAGAAPEEWMPMRPPEFYEEGRIALRLGARAAGLDALGRTLRLEGGETVPFDALLLATGAEAVGLSVPGAGLSHVHTLRTLVDARAVIAAARSARRAVVVGASFIGLEAAAALRTRGIEVRVVSPDGPLQRVLGPEVGGWVRALHEEHGVEFRIGPRPVSITPHVVELSDGTALEAELVVAGIGVRPSVGLAREAGLAVDEGVLVDRFLESSAPGIWAAGDIARWPEAGTGRRLRVEHWVVAQRQGETAARNMLGAREPFRAVPYFWSQHYDAQIQVVGHAGRWDSAEVRGSLAKRDFVAAYREAGRIAAVASVGRDRASLEAETAFARDDQAALEELLRR